MGRLVYKKGCILFFLILFCALLGKGWYYCIDGFRMARVRFDLTQGQLGSSLDPQLSGALSQTYCYLSRGRQCYAFESEDGKYVLKLPRGDSFRLPFWLRACSFSFLDPLREARLADKNKRFNFLMDSFVLALQELKDKTALLYVHLKATNHLQIVLPVQDRLGRSHPLDLDGAVFVLQEKKELMLPRFKEHLKRGDREGAQKILESFIELVSYRAQRGILNKDPSFRRNFGCDGDQVVQIDIGSFYRPIDKKYDFSFSFQQTMEPVDQWLATIDPDMQSWFQKKVKQRVEEEL